MRCRGFQTVAFSAVLAVGWACAGAEPSQQAAVDLWTVDSTSVVTIGFGRDEPEYLFERIVQASRLSDGRIVVVDRGSSELRYFSPEGEHLLTAGGQGGGPGELQGVLDATWMPGDSIGLLSTRPGITVYSAEGVFARQEPLRALGTRFECRITHDGWNLLPDATVLSLSEDNVGIPGCPPLPEGLWQPSMLIARYRPGSAGADTLAVVPGRERVGRYDRVFGRLLSLAFSPEWIYLADTGSDSIRTISFEGAPGPVLAIPFAAREIPQSSMTEKRRLAKLRDGSVEDHGPYNYPTHFPRIGRMVAGRDGRLWVAEYPTLDTPLMSMLVMNTGPKSYEWPVTWRLLDEDGAAVGQLVTPADFFPLEFGTDHVLGITWDDYYVQAVRLYRIRALLAR